MGPLSQVLSILATEPRCNVGPDGTVMEIGPLVTVCCPGCEAVPAA